MYLTARMQEKTICARNCEIPPTSPGMKTTVIELLEITDGEAAAAVLQTEAGPRGLIVIRRGEQVHVYLNSCPHVGVRLDLSPGQFMSIDGKFLQCTTHGALFEPDTGSCVEGPCQGASLVRLAAEVTDGKVMVDNSQALPRSARL